MSFFLPCVLLHFLRAHIIIIIIIIIIVFAYIHRYQCTSNESTYWDIEIGVDR